MVAPLLCWIWPGTDHYARLLHASSLALAEGHLFYGLEALHDDGAWKTSTHLWRTNGVRKYSRGDAALGWSMSAFGYHGRWNATDPIPERAVTGKNTVPGDFRLDRFDTLDPNSSGDSERFSLSGEWHRADDENRTSVLVYAYRYGLSLYSNFTGYLNQAESDEILQLDRRIVAGAKLSHTFFGSWAGHESQARSGSTFGPTSCARACSPPRSEKCTEPYARMACRPRAFLPGPSTSFLGTFGCARWSGYAETFTPSTYTTKRAASADRRRGPSRAPS